MIRGVLLLHNAAQVHELLQLAFALNLTLALYLGGLLLRSADLDQISGLLMAYLGHGGERDAGHLGGVALSCSLATLDDAFELVRLLVLHVQFAVWRRRIALERARAPKVPHGLERIEGVAVVHTRLSDGLSRWAVGVILGPLFEVGAVFAVSHLAVHFPDDVTKVLSMVDIFLGARIELDTPLVEPSRVGSSQLSLGVQLHLLRKAQDSIRFYRGD